MIAKLEIPKCPFRKETVLCGVETQNQFQNLGNIYQENFLECIEEECIAWSKLKRDCRLIDKK